MGGVARPTRCADALSVQSEVAAAIARRVTATIARRPGRREPIRRANALRHTPPAHPVASCPVLAFPCLPALQPLPAPPGSHFGYNHALLPQLARSGGSHVQERSFRLRAFHDAHFSRQAPSALPQPSRRSSPDCVQPPMPTRAVWSVTCRNAGSCCATASCWSLDSKVGDFEKAGRPDRRHQDFSRSDQTLPPAMRR